MFTVFTTPKEGQMKDKDRIVALAQRLLDHAKEMPDGSLMLDDFIDASKGLLTLLEDYGFACMLVASLNDAIHGEYNGDPVGPLKDAMLVRSDAERYHWLRQNITRLVVTTDTRYLEDGGYQTVVSGLALNPNFRVNTDFEFFDKLVDTVRFDEGEHDGAREVRAILQDDTGGQAPALRVV